MNSLWRNIRLIRYVGPLKLSGARWNTPAEEKGILGFDCIAMQTPMPADFSGLASKIYFSDAGQKLFNWLARKHPQIH